MGAQGLLIFSIVTAAFAAVVLATRTRAAEHRFLFLLTIGLFVFTEFTVMRLSGATSDDEATAAARALFLVLSVSSIPWAVLATRVPTRRRWSRHRARTAVVVAIAVFGFGLATCWQTDLVIDEVSRSRGVLHVTLGKLGRLLLVYMIAVAAYVLTQVEMSLRAALRLKERVPKVVVAMIGISVIVYAYTMTEAFYYGQVNTQQMAAASVPASITFLIIGFASLRRSFDDMRLPVGRGVVYSSFTIFILGLMMLLLWVFAQIADVAGLSVDQTFTVAVTLLAAVMAVTMWVNPTWKRRVSVYIDENFYVNRHDYRKEWKRISQRVRPTLQREALVKSISDAIAPIFATSDVYIGIRNPESEIFSMYRNDGSVVTDLAPKTDGPLARVLERRNEAVPLNEVHADLDLIPGFVQFREAFDHLGVRVLVPMISGEHLVGILLVARERLDVPYSPEDLNLMTVLGSELANAVYGHLLLREVEERREGEALVRISSFMLHDLKNCVSSIRGAVEGAERYLDQPAFRSDLVATLSSTSDRMGRLIERLSEVGTRPTGTVSPRMPCSISTLVEHAVSQSGAQAHPGIEFDSHVPDDLSTMGDREMLEQVFVNLIRNALDAVGERGAVSVRAIRVGREIQVDIEDDGCGMSSAFLADSLFRPFATTKSHGLGIGLYQCKNIIEDHGGMITVVSTEGRGTRVTGDPARRGRSDMADATRILIVDDEIGIRNQLKWGFRDAFDVRDVDNQDEAIRVLDAWHPHVVLLDVHLEGETCEAGFDILRHAVDRDIRTKVIMVTGELDPVRASRAIELGAWDYYAKPIEIDELRLVVARAARVRELQAHTHRKSGNGNGNGSGNGLGRAADLESWLGRSAAARRVTRLIHSLAASGDPVLVLGEPGTGRELAGQALHSIAGRAPVTYIALDLTEDLPPVESLPEGGTYWIEDITRLSGPSHERFPEWAESASERGRVVAGGPVDLAERAAAHAVPTGTYNFLAALTVSLPPLRERPDDIVVVATAMIAPLAARVGVVEKQLSDEALTSLSRYSWPGNLHELERRLTGALFVASGDTVTDDDLWPQSPGPKQLGLKGNLNVLERSLVERAVREHHGNVSQAARSLSVSRPTLHSLLRKHDIDPEPFRVAGGAG